MNLFSRNILICKLIIILLMITVAGCSSPEDKAEKYYQKGLALLKSDPDKARLEFSNALQIKKNMTKAIYGIALVAERKGDWKTAFDTMNQVLDLDAKHIDSLVKTGQILLAGERLDLALDRSDKAYELDKNHIGALNLRAALKLKFNDATGAVEYANIVLAKQPDNQDAYMVLATERLSVKDEAKALEYFDKILAKDDKNIAIHLIRIKTLENMSKVAEAEQAFKNLVQQQPSLSLARKSYAQFLVKHKRNDEAEQQLREVAKATQKDIQPKLDVVRFLIATKGVEAGRAELENLVKADANNHELSFALVNLYKAQKDTAQENKLLNEIVQNAGETADRFRAQGLIAYNLVQQGKREEALKLIETILEKDKANGQALTIRAGLSMDAANYTAAISDLRTVLRDTPEASGAALMLASAFENVDSPELAEEQYIKAFVSGKYAERYGLPYVQFLLKNKKIDRAEKTLESMLQANPNNTDALGALAQVKIAKGDFDGAKTLATKAEQSNKSSVADQILGAISTSKNDVDGSLVAYLRAHESDPQDSKPIAAVVNTYIQAGKSAEALAFTESVLKENPNYTEVKLLQGQIYAYIGNDQKAGQTFNEVINKQPNNSLAYRELAISQIRAKLNTSAEDTIRRGLANIPNDAELKLLQAGIYEEKMQYEDAIKSYEDVLKVRHNSPIASNNLASLLLDHRADKVSLARAYALTKSLKGSEVPQLLDTYGWASYKTGRFDDAEKALKLAVEKMPDYPTFHFHLAKVYIAKNEKMKAKQALESASKYASKHPFNHNDEVKSLLQSLQSLSMDI